MLVCRNTFMDVKEGDSNGGGKWEISDLVSVPQTPLYFVRRSK